VKVAHLTTVDMSLRYLVMPQLLAVRDVGGEAVGISAPGPWVAELEEAGIRHIALRSSTRGMDPLADIRAARELWQILKRERFDVLHTHNPKPGLYGRVLGRLSGVPVVVNTVHGLYATPDDPAIKRAIVYGLEAMASRFSDAELVQSPEDLRLLRRWRISPRDKTTLLGNGVDLARFNPSRFDDDDRARVRALLGVSDHEIVVGMVGRLVLEKGYLELFEAAKRIGHRYVVLAIGPHDPEKADALPDAVVSDAITAGVRFLGMRDDVDELYAAMDIFVLPSHREGFPRAAMEAAASGLPVIATDIRGCRQVVDDGVNGFLVRVRDPDMLASRIEDLGVDDKVRARMGRAGRMKAEAEFDERRVVERVMATYDRVRRQIDGRSHRRRKPVHRVAKRVLDVALSASALLVLSPVMIGLGIAVRISLGSPVLFRQQRPGLNGEPFTILKFRTMLDSTDEHGAPLPDEQRLTRFGKALRATSLDELPELINVLRGEMSLVGPRPLLTRYLELYTPTQARRHEVRPGITGWAQVHGRNDSPWSERLAADVWYVDNWSLWLDLQIMARTIVVVVRREGVSQENRATVDYFTGIEEGDDE